MVWSKIAAGIALIKGNNLSDLTSASTARTNLGLGTAATSNTGDFDSANAANNLVDLIGLKTFARSTTDLNSAMGPAFFYAGTSASNTPVSGTAFYVATLAARTAGVFYQIAWPQNTNPQQYTRYTTNSGSSWTAWAVNDPALDLKIANNLSDLANAATARTNLGLGTAATRTAISFAQSLTQRTLAANTSVTAVINSVYYAAGGSTVNLPQASSVAAGSIVQVHKSDTGTLVTVAAGSVTDNFVGVDATYGGSTGFYLSALGMTATLQSDGTSWYVQIDGVGSSGPGPAYSWVVRDGNNRSQVADPSAAQDIATKNYVDNIGFKNPTNGGTINYNTMVTPGVYYGNTTSTNGPAASTSYALFVLGTASATAVVQMAVGYVTSNAPSIWTRSTANNGTAWTSWVSFLPDTASAPVTATNSSNVVSTAATVATICSLTLGIGTWQVNAGTTITAAASTNADVRIAVGTATATFAGQQSASTRITAANQPWTPTIAGTIVTVTAAGTVLFQMEGTAALTALTSSNQYTFAGSSGMTAVRIM